MKDGRGEGEGKDKEEEEERGVVDGKKGEES